MDAHLGRWASTPGWFTAGVAAGTGDYQMLVEELIDQQDALVTELLVAIGRAVDPRYRDLVVDECRPHLQRLLPACLRCMRDGSRITASDLAPIVVASEGRASLGVPVSASLSAIRGAIGRFGAIVVRRAGIGRAPAVASVLSQAAIFSHDFAQAVIAGRRPPQTPRPLWMQDLPTNQRRDPAARRAGLLDPPDSPAAALLRTERRLPPAPADEEDARSQQDRPRRAGRQTRPHHPHRRLVCRSRHGRRPGSPFEHRLDLDGHILLIGVGHNRNSFLHHAESLTPKPRLKQRRFPMLVDGERVWWETTDVGDDNDTHFPGIGEGYEYEADVTSVTAVSACGTDEFRVARRS